MLGLMCCGIVDTEQWMELLHGFLGNLTTQLLGLIQNQDGIGLGNNIDGPTGAKAIRRTINNTSHFVTTTTCSLFILIQGCSKGLIIPPAMAYNTSETKST